MNNPLFYVAPAFTWQFDTPMVCKGPSDLQKQTGNTAYSTAGGLQGNASNINQFLVPELQSEVTNPTGIGQLGLNELTTNEGQAVAGQLGGANEAAQLRASRTGNPSSTTALQDAATRSGMTQMSTNSRDAAIQDLKTKIGQQSQGLQGLTGLEKEQQSAALDALGLTNTTEKDISQEQQAQFNSILDPILGLGGAVAGAAGQAIGGHK